MESQRPANFNGLDDEFSGVPSTAETRQKADEAFRNSSDTRARSQSADADANIDAIDEGVEELKQLTERPMNPAAAAEFDRLCQEAYGVSASELRRHLATAVHVGESVDEVYTGLEAQRFMVATPEYEATPGNSEKLIGFIREQGLPFNQNTLSYAYDTLRKQGELEGGREPRTVSQRQAHVGLSDYSGARQSYSGDDGRTNFDVEAFRTLSSSARRQYVAAVEYAEKNGHKVPTVAEFKRLYRASPAD